MMYIHLAYHVLRDVGRMPSFVVRSGDSKYASVAVSAQSQDVQDSSCRYPRANEAVVQDRR